MANEFLPSEKVGKKSIYIKSAVLGVIVTFAFMLLFSAVLLFLNLDRAYAKPFATVSVAAGSFVAAYYAAKKIGDRGYLIGFVIGIIVFAIITIISMIINKVGLGINTLFHFLIITLSALVGGIMEVNADKHKKYI